MQSCSYIHLSQHGFTFRSKSISILSHLYRNVPSQSGGALNGSSGWTPPASSSKLPASQHPKEPNTKSQSSQNIKRGSINFKAEQSIKVREPNLTRTMPSLHLIPTTVLFTDIKASPLDCISEGLKETSETKQTRMPVESNPLLSTALVAYSTWKTRPSGEKVVTDRS